MPGDVAAHMLTMLESVANKPWLDAVAHPFAEAEAVISALERDYGESKIYTMGGRGGRGGRGPGGPPSLQSGSSAAAQLRQRMNAPRN